tara:strand:- start:227 stop:466 length:240 start_codon:yes stop_codon:yes gene_type:complete
MNKELIDTVESLGGTALMGGILIQFSDTTFAEALKKIYEAGAEAEREACAKIADQYVGQDLEHNFSALVAHNIRARGQA